MRIDIKQPGHISTSMIFTDLLEYETIDQWMNGVIEEYGPDGDSFDPWVQYKPKNCTLTIGDKEYIVVKDEDIPYGMSTTLDEIAAYPRDRRIISQNDTEIEIDMINWGLKIKMA